MYNSQSHDTTAIAFEITLLLLAENEVAQVSYFGQDNFSAYRKIILKKPTEFFENHCYY